MATINGKPSIFQSVEPPTPKHPTYAERVADFTAVAKEMAETESRRHTLCEQCQADMTEWRLANPTATQLQAEAVHAKIWENCPPCAATFAEWCDEVDRQAQREASSLETLEHEAYEAHLEAQAEAHTLQSLGESYLENGSDLS